MEKAPEGKNNGNGNGELVEVDLLGEIDDAEGYEVSEEKQKDEANAESRITEIDSDEFHRVPDILTRAAFYNDPVAIKTALASGASPDNKTVFHNRSAYANWRREPEPTKFSKERAAWEKKRANFLSDTANAQWKREGDIESDYNPLFFAVHQDSLDAAEALLEAGADPNFVYSGGETPIFFAKSHNMVLLLRKYGADLGLKNHNGVTALTQAAEAETGEAITGFLVEIEAVDGTILPPAEVDRTVTTSDDGTKKPLVTVILESLDRAESGYIKQEKIWQEERVAALSAAAILAEEQLAEEYADENPPGMLIIALRHGLLNAFSALLRPVNFQDSQKYVSIYAKTADGNDIFVSLKKLAEQNLAERERLSEAKAAETDDEKLDRVASLKLAERDSSKIAECLEHAAEAIQRVPVGNGHFAGFFRFLKHDRGVENNQIAQRMGVFEGYVDAVEMGLIVPDDANLERLYHAFNILEGSFEDVRIGEIVVTDRKNIEAEAQKTGGTKKVKLIRALSAVNIDTALSSFTDHFLAGTTNGAGRGNRGYYYNRDIASAVSGLPTEKVSNTIRDDRLAIEERGTKTRYKGKVASRTFVDKFADGLSKTATKTREVELRNFIEVTIRDICFDRVSRKAFSELIDDYIEAAINAGEEINLHNFSTYWADEWRITNEQLVEELEVKIFHIFHATNYGNADRVHTDVLEKVCRGIEKIEGKPLEDETKKKLHAIRHGNLRLGSVDDLAEQALAILADENPQIENHVGNPVLDYMLEKMPAQRSLIQYGAIDKVLVPTALFAVLCESTGHTVTVFMKKTGLTFKKNRRSAKVEELLTGDTEFTLYLEGAKKGQFASRREDYAVRSAEFFSSCPETSKKLTAAFLARSKFYTPDELMDLWQEEKIQFAQALTILRLQEGASYLDWAKIVSPTKVNPFPASIQRLEERGGFLASPKEAERLASHIYRNFPHDHSQDDFTLALQGKLSRITSADIEAEVERAYLQPMFARQEPEYGEVDTRNPAFVLPVDKKIMLEHQKHVGGDKDAIKKTKPKSRREIYDMMVEVGAGTYQKASARFREIARHRGSNDKMTNVRPSFVQFLTSDRKAGTSFILAARASARAAGLNSERQTQFARVCENKIMRYDPRPINDLISSKRSAEDIGYDERGRLIRTLRDNISLAKKDIWSRTPQTEASYDLVEERGYVWKNDPTRSLKIEDVLDALVPKSYPRHREFLRTMLETKSKHAADVALRDGAKAAVPELVR